MASPVTLRPPTMITQPRRAPTEEELVQIYRFMVKNAFAKGKAEKLDGPPVQNPNDFPSVDITPTGMQDVTKRVFDIEGQLYYRVSSMFGPQGTNSTWYRIGTAPIF